MCGFRKGDLMDHQMQEGYAIGFPQSPNKNTVFNAN